MNVPVAVPNKNTDVAEPINKEKIIRYLDTFGLVDQLSEQEKEQFVEIACAYQLNPFKREIYCVPYEWIDKQTGEPKRKLSIITGYESYLKRAERTQQLNGWNVKTAGKSTDGTLRAQITIYRKDWEHPFEHEVWLREYNQKNKMWYEKPVTMIKKVAVVQGFRMAFSDEFGGMPYTAEELPEEMTEPVEPKPQTQTKQQGNFKKASRFISSADPDGIIKAKKGLHEYSWNAKELEELESMISIREDELTQEVA